VKLEANSLAYDNKDGRLRGRKLQAARLRIWVRDPHCAMCGKLVTLAYPSIDGFELDHKDSIKNDGSNDDDNLQVLCASIVGSTKTGCHVAKTNKDEGHKGESSWLGPKLNDFVGIAQRRHVLIEIAFGVRM